MSQRTLPNSLPAVCVVLAKCKKKKKKRGVRKTDTWFSFSLSMDVEAIRFNTTRCAMFWPVWFLCMLRGFRRWNVIIIRHGRLTWWLYCDLQVVQIVFWKLSHWLVDFSEEWTRRPLVKLWETHEHCLGQRKVLVETSKDTPWAFCFGFWFGWPEMTFETGLCFCVRCNVRDILDRALEYDTFPDMSEL